jgi:hypothetical protein
MCEGMERNRERALYEDGDGDTVNAWACDEWPMCACQGQVCEKAARACPGCSSDACEPVGTIESVTEDERGIAYTWRPTSDGIRALADAAGLPRRVYLAGPMTGFESYNFPAFHAAAADLRSMGIEVWSPAENDEAHGFDPANDEAAPLATYMLDDLPAVLKADAVVVLPGWELSRGASLEVHVARTCGIPVLAYPELEPIVERFMEPPTPEARALGPELDARLSETVLDEAQRITSRDRQDVYGHPGDDFARTAGMVSALLRDKLTAPITPGEWASVMVLVKLSRLQTTPGHRDSLVDIAGYARCAEMVYERDGGR